MKRVIRTCMTAAVIVGALASGAALAQSQQAAVDADGRLRAPTAEERAALTAPPASPDARQAARLRAAGALRPATEAQALKGLKTNQRGGYVQVPESLDSSLVARRAADGHLVIEHQGGIDAAAAQPKAAEAVR